MIRHPPQGPPSRTAFLGDYKFPREGKLARRAAKRSIDHSASWSETDIWTVDSLADRIREAKPEDLRHLSDCAKRVAQMMREVCTRAAKYEVAMNALLERVEELEQIAETKK